MIFKEYLFLGKCQKCNVDISDSGVFFASCLKQCKGYVFPNYIHVAVLFPGYSTETYDEDVEYEEHELCSIAHKPMLMGFEKRHPNEWPPLSSLWFMSRIQYADDVKILEVINDLLFLNNLRTGVFQHGVHHDSIHDMRYIDLGLLDGKYYTQFNATGNHWFNPLPSVRLLFFKEQDLEHIIK
uniref:Uncharacterized protein n=1 Tax=Panagrolaimus sp. JU765 TaxID=591449 RepID=A0AC34RDI2_9BILA